MENKALPRNMSSDLSQSRSFLMGIAILGVVMFHVRARSWCPEDPVSQFLNTIISGGYGGCDIFLFLSGFGLAFSLNRDGNYLRYIGRRVYKLFPAYYPFILVFIASMMFLKGMTVLEALGNLTFTGFWLKQNMQFNWYVQSVMVFYLLAPAAYQLMKRLDFGWKGLLAVAVISLVSQLLFWGEYQLIAISRVPVFLLGLYFGGLKKERLGWSWKNLLALTMVLVAGIVFWRWSIPYLTWENGLYWYPFLLIAPALCLLLAWLRPYWLKVKPLAAVDRLICLCGVCSFEIYLIHDFVFEWLLVHIQGNLFWLIMAPVCTALGIGYHYLIESAMEKWKAARSA